MLTAELDAMRLNVNTKGAQREFLTFTGTLTQQGTASAALYALRNSSPVGAAARKAVACLLWMNGTLSAQLEQIVMQHLPNRDAIGPIRAVA